MGIPKGKFTQVTACSDNLFEKKNPNYCHDELGTSGCRIIRLKLPREFKPGEM